MRRRATVASLLGMWLALGVGLSALATRVGDWFDMTDEMRYERLAISIVRDHSLNPQIHGVRVANWSQLYPLLIAPALLHGHVPHDLRLAHLINGWVMSSSCIPGFLLARRVTRRSWIAYVLAVLALSIPWILYATMLMTEVVAYPVFLWAIHAFQRSIASPSPRNDVFALLVLPVAYFARTPLLVVGFVLPAALIGFELGRLARPLRRAIVVSIRAHAVLVGGYLAFGIAALVLELRGSFSTVFGLYGYYASNRSLIGRGFAGAFVDHLSTFSLGIGVLPFVVGSAWLLANSIRPSPDRELHVFACIGLASVLAVSLQASSFDLRYANYVHDRFMLYLAPLLLLAAVCAVTGRRAPRWSLLLPCALVVCGFVFGAIQEGALKSGVPIDPDDPVALYFTPIVRLTHGIGGMRVLLALATVLVTGLFAVASRLIGRRGLAIGFVGLLLLLVPAETSYAFVRLFGLNGYSGRPLTVNLSGVDDWVDQTVGTNANVTEVPYPVSTDYNLDTITWQDYEFWNKSVDRDLQDPGAQIFEPSGFWFPKQYVQVDPETGAVNVSPTRYALTADQESRFRISGTALADKNGVMLIDAAQPWRVDWLTFGLYVDGWTKPHVAARVRVFPAAGQRAARVRFVTIAFRSPDQVSEQPVEVRSNLDHWVGQASTTTNRAELRVCLPAHGFAEVRVRTPVSSKLPADLSNGLTQGETNRQGGIFISEISVADEVGGPCKR